MSSLHDYELERVKKVLEQEDLRHIEKYVLHEYLLSLLNMPVRKR